MQRRWVPLSALRVEDIERFRVQLALPSDTRRGYLVKINEGRDGEVAAGPQSLWFTELWALNRCCGVTDAMEAAAAKAVRKTERGALYNVLKGGMDPSDARFGAANLLAGEVTCLLEPRPLRVSFPSASLTMLPFLVHPILLLRSHALLHGRTTCIWARCNQTRSSASGCPRPRTCQRPPKVFVCSDACSFPLSFVQRTMIMPHHHRFCFSLLSLSLC